MSTHYKVGTAAWAIPKEVTQYFPEQGQNLAKYSQRLNAVEINTSFYRDHKPSTYSKWAEMVPDYFRFSVKLSRVFTHDHRLEKTEGLKELLNGISELGKKLGVVLVQLPPSLTYQEKTAKKFFSELRKNYTGKVAFEPRHLSWVSDEALKFQDQFEITKVVADPEPCPLSMHSFKRAKPQLSFQYYRLHGSPVIYRSSYAGAVLKSWIQRMREDSAQDLWCIFDNTALGYATGNALETLSSLELSQLKSA